MTSGAANETIGRRLRRLRKERGLAQRELTGPGVSHAYVSRIEADLRTPSVKAIRKLAAKLGVSPDYLERGLDVDVADERELRVLNSELTLSFGGDATEAERTLSEAAEEASRDGDTPGLTRAMIGLGNLALARGDHEQALRCFEPALVADEVSPASHLRLYTDTAACYGELGLSDRAESFLRNAIERLEEEAPGSAFVRARLELSLGLALIDLGRGVEAESLLVGAAQELRAESDSEQTIRSLWAQARSDSEAGRHRAALNKMRKATALREAMDERKMLTESREFLAKR
ncbi:MAG: tetratricopeptide repeat protein [Gaiellaceae bacterium]